MIGEMLVLRQFCRLFCVRHKLDYTGVIVVIGCHEGLFYFLFFLRSIFLLFVADFNHIKANAGCLNAALRRSGSGFCCCACWSCQ